MKPPLAAPLACASDPTPQTRSRRGRLGRWIPVVFVAILILLISQGGPWILWEKFFTDAVLPCNVVLFALAAVTLHACRRGARSVARWLATTTGLYAIAGNAWVGAWLMYSLEAPYVHLHPLDAERYDVLVVLGGGTNVGANGVPQLGPSSGDRLMLAARLYHQGKVGQLICTGIPLVDIPGATPSGPASESRAILVDVGIPAAVIRPGEGRNTYEEMQYLRRVLPTYGSAPRVGLLTSAWHLPRAVRLAERAGITVAPVPADFASGGRTFSLRRLLPSPDGFRLVHFALREHLARFCGR